MRRKPYISLRLALPGMCWCIMLRNFALELHCRSVYYYMCLIQSQNPEDFTQLFLFFRGLQ